MKTKTLTIELNVRKYNAVHETAAFEAILKVARMVNADSIAMEAATRVLGGYEGRYVRGPELKSIIILLHTINRKASWLLEELWPDFEDSPSFAGFLTMSDQGQDEHGTAPQEQGYVDIKMISSNARVASAIRRQDLVGKALLIRQDDRLCPAEAEAQESFAYYQETAEREQSPRIYNKALKISYRWAFQFNFAALIFIRGQCKELRLPMLEEQAIEIRETIGVH